MTAISFSPMLMSRQASHVKKVTRPTVTLSVIARQLAAVIYTAESEYLGDQRELFSALPVDRQHAYELRAKIVVLSGIGWVAGKAKETAIRHVSTEKELFYELSEAGAKLAEDAMGELFDAYECALLNLGSRGQR